MKRIMLDLETFGTRPGSVILCIGAVEFGDNEIRSSFYEWIDLRSSADYGLKTDPETVQWWEQQSYDALAELHNLGIPIGEALSVFERYISCLGPEIEVWGNGSDFDNVLLAEAYRIGNRVVPWTFRQNRCYRTLRALVPSIPFAPPVMRHNALQDATAQAKHLMRILDHLSPLTGPQQ